jgi:hypothetical protein
MKLNPKEKAVLAGVLRDAEDLAGLDPASLGLPYGVALGRVKIKVADAKGGYVPMNLADWIGHARPPFTHDALNKWLDEVLEGLDMTEFMSARP